jgi:hypothetical protein
MHKTTLPIYALLITMLLFSCNAYMHGYTEKKAQNRYYPVNGNEQNFGDRRIKYNRGFHRHSALDRFIGFKGMPAYIYEYKTPRKCRGIKLFYTNIDSVFIFEEPRKGNLNTVFKTADKISVAEKQIFETLSGNK